jgi:hypothetical protein
MRWLMLVAFGVFGAVNCVCAGEAEREAGGREEVLERLAARKPDPALPITAEYLDVPLFEAVNNISERAALSVVLSRPLAELAGPVSVRLIRVPAEDALRALARAVGMELLKIGGEEGKAKNGAGAVTYVFRAPQMLPGERLAAVADQEAAGRRNRLEAEEMEMRMERMRDFRERMERRRMGQQNDKQAPEAPGAKRPAPKERNVF